MKAINTIVKLLAALAAIAGAIYVVATYGDKIVAWAKKLWATLPQCAKEEVVVESDFASAQAAEPVPQESTETVAEEVAQEVPVEEVAPVIADNEPVAEEADFAE